MTRINKLTQNPELLADDLFVIWDNDNQRTRSITAETLNKFTDTNGASAQAFVDGYIQGGILYMVRANDEVVNIGSIPNTEDGFADYNDVATGVTPISLVANTWTTLTNDGAGAFTNLGYLPSGVTRLMDTSTGQFDFSELKLGDNCFIRNDFSVTPQTNNALLKLRYQLGAGANSYTLETILGRLDSGSGIPYRFSLVPQMIYMGDLNTKDNPITLQLNLSAAGTVVNAGSAIGVTVR